MCIFASTLSYYKKCVFFWHCNLSSAFSFIFAESIRPVWEICCRNFPFLSAYQVIFIFCIERWHGFYFREEFFNISPLHVLMPITEARDFFEVPYCFGNVAIFFIGKVCNLFCSYCHDRCSSQPNNRLAALTCLKIISTTIVYYISCKKISTFAGFETMVR